MSKLLFQTENKPKEMNFESLSFMGAAIDLKRELNKTFNLFMFLRRFTLLFKLADSIEDLSDITSNTIFEILELPSELFNEFKEIQNEIGDIPEYKIKSYLDVKIVQEKILNIMNKAYEFYKNNLNDIIFDLKKYINEYVYVPLSENKDIFNDENDKFVSVLNYVYKTLNDIYESKGFSRGRNLLIKYLYSNRSKYDEHIFNCTLYFNKTYNSIAKFSQKPLFFIQKFNRFFHKINMNIVL